MAHATLYFSSLSWQFSDFNHPKHCEGGIVLTTVMPFVILMCFKQDNDSELVIMDAANMP